MGRAWRGLSVECGIAGDDVIEVAIIWRKGGWGGKEGGCGIRERGFVGRTRLTVNEQIDWSHLRGYSAGDFMA